jgi:Prokaryotic homologs of the JAB domain
MSMMHSREAGVHRTKSWPTGPLRGRFIIIESVIQSTERALVTSRGPEGAHEGIVFWAGIESGNGTMIFAAIIPESSHGPQHVKCSETQIRDASQAARRLHLGILGQVHSHGGEDARHSDGDDELILMPFEGMLSIVVPHYGRRGMRPLEGCGIHQFQSKRWVLCTAELANLRTVASAVDLR